MMSAAPAHAVAGQPPVRQQVREQRSELSCSRIGVLGAPASGEVPRRAVAARPHLVGSAECAWNHRGERGVGVDKSRAHDFDLYAALEQQRGVGVPQVVKRDDGENFYNYNRHHGSLDGHTPYERLRQKTTNPM